MPKGRTFGKVNLNTGGLVFIAVFAELFPLVLQDFSLLGKKFLELLDGILVLPYILQGKPSLPLCRRKVLIKPPFEDLPMECTEMWSLPHAFPPIAVGEGK